MNINDNIEKVLISEEELKKRIKELSLEISKDYEDKNPVMLCLLKGSVSYYAHLCENMYIPLEYEFLRASSYHGATSTGEVKLISLPTISLENRHVIVVEDIIDTGLTAEYLIGFLNEKFSPKTVKFCSLLNKKEMRKSNVEPDFYGFDIDNKFVVGYGLDDAGYCRNLPYIGYKEV